MKFALNTNYPKNRIFCECVEMEFFSTFELEQCFCSCMNEHSDNCPNKGREEPKSHDSIKIMLKTDDGKLVQLEADIINKKFTVQ